MSAKRTCPIAKSLSILLVLLCFTQQTHAITSTWICEDGGNYSNTACWDPLLSVPPCNFDPFYFDVIIPAGTGTITMDLSSCQVNTFFLGAGRRFLVRGGNSYSVQDSATLYGTLIGDGGTFEAKSATFEGLAALVEARNGATVEIGAPEYSSAGIMDSADLFVASDPNTKLILSSLSSINDGFNSISSTVQAHTISVSQGGSLDLSGVGTTTGPCDREDYLDILVLGEESSLDLSSLTSVLNAGLGYTRFTLSDGATVSLPSLQDVRQTRFNLSDRARLYANGPSPVSYSSAGYAYDLILMKAVDSNTVLDLSAITSVNAGFNSGSSAAQIHSITASNGGRIDLSGVETFTAPFDGEDHLDVSVAGAGSSLDLSSLKTIETAGFGWARFLVSDGASLSLPKLEDLRHVCFDLSGGAQLFADGPEPASYSSTAMSGSSTLMKVVGLNTLLDLSCVSEIDAGFNSGSSATQIHTISVTDRGHIDLSHVETINVPNDDEDTINIYARSGGSIDLSSLATITGRSRSGLASFDIGSGSELAVGDLEISATTSISLDGGATLLAKSLTATKSTSITLGSSSGTVVIAGDLDLGTVITISDDGNGSLHLGGDFTYAHTDESQLPLAGSSVYFTGDGPQELEVGGTDVRVYTDIVILVPPDNFGYGQMVVGEPNRATTVVLVDHIDNGNRQGFFGDPDEALYLFGKDGMDGLRILGGSTLYMNGLAVYAMFGNAARPTDLRTLFAEGQDKIAFDEGWLCLGAPKCDDPQNLIQNGCFETGLNPPTAEEPVRVLPDTSSALDGWDVVQNTVDWTHETLWADAGDGERFVVLGGDLGAGAVSQTIFTVPDQLYRVYFDVAVLPSTATGAQLTVSAAGDSETLTLEAGTAIQWLKRTWHFTAVEDLTTLTFVGTHTGLNVPSGIAIDNLVVLGLADCKLTVTATAGGSVTVTDANSVVVVGPGEVVELSCDCGAMLDITAEPDEGYRFIRWTGNVVDVGLVPDSTDPSLRLMCSGITDLTAEFDVACVVFWEELLDSDPGWEMTGQWEFGVPTGQHGSDHGYNDPTVGYTRQNVIGVNLDGCYALAVGGPFWVETGPIDASGCTHIELSFARWLNTDSPEFVSARIEYSIDGGTTWDLLWAHEESRRDITDSEWVIVDYDLPPEADNQPDLRLRWGYEVLGERVWAYTGWNLDDIRLCGRTQ